METTNPKQNNNKKFTPQTQGGARRGGRRPRSFDRPKPEFDQKIVSIRRVTRVVKGGRRMTFAVAMAIGDKKGSVGLGTGKGGDTAIAINKAVRQAKKSMFKIQVTKDMSIPYQISEKFSSSKIVMIPNNGKGLVAGSTVRDMLALAGLKNITAKINSRSKNKLNNARAAYNALYNLKIKGGVAKSKPFVSEEILKEKDSDKVVVVEKKN